jgi:hypothetical protein
MHLRGLLSVKRCGSPLVTAKGAVGRCFPGMMAQVSGVTE